MALIPEGVLIGRRALNQIIATCKQFCHHYLMKKTPIFHLIIAGGRQPRSNRLSLINVGHPN